MRCGSTPRPASPARRRRPRRRARRHRDRRRPRPGSSVRVTAADPTNYTASLPVVSIGKDINAVNPLTPTVTEQADTAATGPSLAAGAPVVWTYRVSTTSSTPITVVSVTDDNATPGDTGDDWNPLPVLVTFQGKQYNVGDTNFDGLLEAGETWLYTSAGAPGAQRTANPGVNVNVGTVVATDANGTTYVASNPAYYTGTVGLALHQGRQRRRPDPADRRRGRQRDRPDGRSPGSTVTFSYLVVNSGSSAVSISDIVDDNGTPGTTTDDVHLAAMTPDLVTFNGASTTSATSTTTASSTRARAGSTSGRRPSSSASVVNTATVKAMNSGGQTLTATDVAQYTGAAGHVTLHTAINAAEPAGRRPSTRTRTRRPARTWAPAARSPTPTSSSTTASRASRTPLSPTPPTASPRKPVLGADGVHNVGDTNKDGILDVGRDVALHLDRRGDAEGGRRAEARHLFGLGEAHASARS